MSLGGIGKKCGMTNIFCENGDLMPVTVICVEPNLVTQVKTMKNDGYYAIQVTTGKRKRILVKKTELGHYAKALVEPGRGLWEFTVQENILDNIKLGDALGINLFRVGQKVDIRGISKGKGFQGVVKRHNFKTQDATHGNSLSHRVHGSTGQNQTPGRVFKGKKMAGHMGNINVTIKALEVIQIDIADGILLLKGSIPGSRGSNVFIKTVNRTKSFTYREDL
jgi:large subunit ribosomal protein L3